MATGTVYLDVDDEITSAAARIRGSEATKVALVVPYGSRISTSRMNFRLLSREAVVNNRRLSIVASDAATRALAASAGLPVFSSMAEYDTAMASDGPSTAEGTSTEQPASPPATAPPPARAAAEDADGPGPGAAAIVAGGAAAGTAAGSAAGAAAPGSPGGDTATARPRSSRNKPPEQPPVSDETQAMAVPPPAPAPVTRAGTTGSIGPGAAAVAAGVGAAGATSSPSVTRAPTVRVPVLRSRRSMPKLGTTALIIAGIALLGLVVVGIAGYVFLPSASIAVTPKEEPIPPISLTVRADPDAVETDPEAGIVPAERLEIPVEVSDTFQTTGRRVEEKTATGAVTFRNVDFTESNTIAGGSIVSTPGGVRFRTDRAVTVGAAKLVGLQIVPTEANVSVTAVSPGETGNVEPNSITVIPAAEDPTTLSVRNKAATSGGTHEEFPQVTEEEVTAALEQLNAQLGESFNAAVADGAGAPANTTLYPETAVLGSSTPTIDPATLVGKEVESFDLGVEATGTVIAVDDSPLEGIARSRLDANVGPDYQLIEDSVDIEQGDATVANGEVSFPMTASASRVRILDPAELLRLVKGKSLADAEAALAPFGEVEITPWPDWVSSIPTMDSRVTLEIVGQDGGGATPSGGLSSAAPDADGSP
jgi:hypothetical protein